MPDQAATEKSRVKSTPAAYVPFKTFLAAIDSLQHGIPGQIDRTIWRNQSGVIQSQILMAFRFFGLVNEEDQPTPELHRLVEHPEKRADHIRALLQHAYRSIFDRDLTRMTPRMLEEAMDQYNVSGDTRRRAISFFLQAAKFADVPMHPLLAGQIRTNSGPRRRRNSRTVVTATDTLSMADSVTAQVGNVKSIDLRSGGKITLNVVMDVFSTSPEDREFVFNLIDLLQKYEEGRTREQ
jgi:hypothetical protein